MANITKVTEEHIGKIKKDDIIDVLSYIITYIGDYETDKGVKCAIFYERGCTKEEVRQWRAENNYTWHERSDCKTMDKVPREVHGNVAHSGGISKMRNQ